MLGVPVGLLSFVVPMYASEVAPTDLRGTLGSLMQLAIVIGILIATVVAVPIQHPDGGWRIGLAICAVPAVVLVSGIWFFPESPRWLCKFKSVEEAAAALRRLRASEQVHTEVNEIAAALEQEAGVQGNWSDLLAPDVRPRVAVAVGLQVLQQATGVNSIFYFAPTIFQEVGIEQPLIGGLVCGIANLIGTVLGIYLVDRQGRRTLLLAGASGMTIGMMTSSLLLFSVEPKEYPMAGYLAILAICFFVICFAVSWGPICWLYPSEIFSMSVRAKAVSLSTLANWVMNVLVGDMVPHLLKWLSAPGLFLLFGICGVGCGSFVFFFVPETKGKSLEEIDKMWNKEVEELTTPRSAQPKDDDHSGL